MEQKADSVTPLTTKEQAEMRKIDRLALRRTATRKQLLRGMDLHRKSEAAFRAASDHE